MKRQVIIVGAGPAGSTAAFYLARAGVDVLLLDKESWPRDKPCGDGLRSPIWPLYKEMGIWDEVLKYSTPSRGVLYGAPNQTTISLIQEDASPLCGPRKIIDYIVAKAAEREGAEFIQNFEVMDLIIKRGYVKGIKGIYQNQSIEIESDMVIIADGAHSRLAHKLGFYHEDPEDIFYAARGYFEDIEGMSDLIEFYYNDLFYPAGYMWVFPMGKTKGNVGTFITEGALERANMRLEDLFDWWRDNTPLGYKRLANARLLGEIKGWRIPTSYGPEEGRNFTNGALIAGDAGNMVERCYGGGQDAAMLAGKDAAETIVEAIAANDYSKEFLTVYVDKLKKSQKSTVYDLFNLTRKYLVTDPNDLNEFVKKYRDENGEAPMTESMGEWIQMKMQAEAKANT